MALAEHGGPNRPTLYEYRPLVGAFVEERAIASGCDDAREALIALKDEPAAGIFAQAHADEGVGEDEALRRTVLIPLLVRTAEGALASTGTTPSSSARTRSSSARSSAIGARTPRSRRSSG